MKQINVRIKCPRCHGTGGEPINPGICEVCHGEGTVISVKFG